MYTDPSGHMVDAAGSYNPWNQTVRDDEGNTIDLTSNNNSGGGDQPGDIDEDVAPRDTAEAAENYGACFTCHANKDNDYWLTYEELDYISNQAKEFQAAGYSSILLSLLIPPANKLYDSATRAALAGCLSNPVCARLIGESVAKATDGVKFPGNPGQTNHIFRDAAGHMTQDTPANRQVLIDTVSPDNLVKVTEKGVEFYARLLGNGTEAWAEVYKNVISNGGVNQTPLHFP